MTDQNQTTKPTPSPGATCSAVPLTIWLQYDGDAPEGETGPVDDGDVTWCRDKIFERDIEYVHAGEIRRELGGHRCSELFGDHGLIAATMRVMDYCATLEAAIINYRDAKGRHNTEIACKRMLECLMNATVELPPPGSSASQ